MPEKPSGPNRILYSSITFGGALAAGLALAVVISLFRPIYSDRRHLSESTGLQVLGSVNMIWGAAQMRKRRLFNVVFAISFVALFVAYGAVVAVYQFDIDVLSRIPVL